LEGSNAGGGFLGFSGLFSPHWAFPMVFVVVIVVVVVVLVALVEFGRGSSPVSGFGCTRFVVGGAIVFFLYVFQQFWQYRVNKHYKRKGVHRILGFL